MFKPRWEVVTLSALASLLLILVSAVAFGLGLSAGSTMRKTAATTATTSPTVAAPDEEECPTFLMRAHDAQLDAAYTAGYHAASAHAQTLQLRNAIDDCTRGLMECRHPRGTP